MTYREERDKVFDELEAEETSERRGGAAIMRNDLDDDEEEEWDPSKPEGQSPPAADLGGKGTLSPAAQAALQALGALDLNSLLCLI